MLCPRLAPDGSLERRLCCEQWPCLVAGAVAQGAGVHCFFRKGSLGAEVCECGGICSEKAEGPEALQVTMLLGLAVLTSLWVRNFILS